MKIAGIFDSRQYSSQYVFKLRLKDSGFRLECRPRKPEVIDGDYRLELLAIQLSRNGDAEDVPFTACLCN